MTYTATLGAPRNNVHYYSYFDTAVNRLLIERGVLDIHKGEVVGFVVEIAPSACVTPESRPGVQLAPRSNRSI